MSSTTVGDDGPKYFDEDCGDYYKVQTPSHGDGRLRVFWIDDLFTDRVEYDEVFRRFFALGGTMGPDGAQHMIEDSLANTTRAASGREAPLLPADINLTDLRLCDAGKECQGRARELHEAAGIHAPSSGFLVGLITAFRWPEHPSIIIPYSGFPDEFGQIWNVARHLLAPAVRVLRDDKINKARFDFDLLTQAAAQAYREKAVADALSNGLMSVTITERDRLETLLDDLGSGGGVPADETIEFVNNHGTRRIMFGALFYDLLNRKSLDSFNVPATVVREWLIQLDPYRTPLELNARALAEAYFRWRRSKQSRQAYRLIRQVQSRVKLNRKDVDERHRLCDEEAKKQGLPVAPPEYPSLFDTPDKRMHRPAFLCLLLLEHRYRLRQSESDAGRRTAKLAQKSPKQRREALNKKFSFVAAVTPPKPLLTRDLFDVFDAQRNINATEIRLLQAYQNARRRYKNASNAEMRHQALLHLKKDKEELAKVPDRIKGDLLLLIEDALVQSPNSVAHRRHKHGEETKIHLIEGQLRLDAALRALPAGARPGKHQNIIGPADPIDDLTMIRLTDPFPGAWDVFLKCNVGNSRKFDALWPREKGSTQDPMFRQIQEGTADLPIIDLLLARRYARELGLRQDQREWPRWLY